jgi:hypothetical protein
VSGVVMMMTMMMTMTMTMCSIVDFVCSTKSLCAWYLQERGLHPLELSGGELEQPLT